jgi:hypothetical protein
MNGRHENLPELGLFAWGKVSNEHAVVFNDWVAPPRGEGRYERVLGPLSEGVGRLLEYVGTLARR